jgi:hypothetical protein
LNLPGKYFDLNLETAQKAAEKLRPLLSQDIFKPVSLDGAITIKKPYQSNS